MTLHTGINEQPVDLVGFGLNISPSSEGARSLALLASNVTEYVVRILLDPTQGKFNQQLTDREGFLLARKLALQLIGVVKAWTKKRISAQKCEEDGEMLIGELKDVVSERLSEYEEGACELVENLWYYTPRLDARYLALSTVDEAREEFEDAVFQLSQLITEASINVLGDLQDHPDADDEIFAVVEQFFRGPAPSN